MTCRTCHKPIEIANGVWWTKGTCVPTCWGRTLHTPIKPNTNSIDDVERWLSA